MSQVFLDCPHCEASNVGMASHYRCFNRRNQGVVFATCNRCSEPVIAIFTLTQNMQHDWRGSTYDVIPNGSKVLAIYPSPRKKVAPDHVEPGLAKLFVQAEEARARGHYHVAGMGLRKTLDVGLKVFDPSVKGDLFTRIDALAAKHDITPAMKDWAHQVRLIGNEAAHEHDEPAKEDIDAMAAFTETLLKYLFTLPAEVRARTPKQPMPGSG